MYAINLYINKQFNKIKLAEVNVRACKSPQKQTKIKSQGFTMQASIISVISLSYPLFSSSVHLIITQSFLSNVKIPTF